MKFADIPQGLQTKVFAMGENATDAIADVLKECFSVASVLLVADENTFDAAGSKVENVLRNSGFSVVEKVIYPGTPRLHPDYAASKELAEKLNESVIPVAVGSGVINDIVKCASGIAEVPYCCVPTAASVDGYTASGAAMRVDEFKTTVPCPAPRAVVADFGVLRSAPAWMLSSGYADLLTKVPGGADWVIADIMGEEKIEPCSWDIVQQDIRKYVSDCTDLGNVFSGLAATGFAMQMYGTSRPASGFEHLCSHVWEMENLNIDGTEISHGFKAGFGALVSTLLMEYMLEHSSSEIASKAVSAPDRQARISEINALLEKGCYGDSVLETALSKFKENEAIQLRRREIYARWESFKNPVRERLIPFEELKNMLKKAGCPVSPGEIGLDRRQLFDGVRRAQLIRVRYNISDLLYEAGVLDDAINRLEILFN